MKHVEVDGDANGVLNVADVVIYGSFLEEPSFPETLKKAMLYGKPIVAPNLTMIRKYVCFSLLLPFYGFSQNFSRTATYIDNCMCGRWESK